MEFDRLADHLVVEEDLVDGEGDVVLRFEEDGVPQLLRRHLGQRNALDDGVTPGDGDDGGRADDPRLLHAFPDGVADDRGLPDAAVGDRVPGQAAPLRGDFSEYPPLLLHELDGLDRPRSDVEPEGRHFLAEAE